MRALIVLVSLCWAFTALAGDLPDAQKTPGLADPTLTKERLCTKGFSTKTVRNVTQQTRKAAFGGYGITCANRTPTCAKEFELDHLRALTDGGANDVKNLWPQSRLTKPWNAMVKDKLEVKLHTLLCNDTMTLEEVGKCLTMNWIKCYQKVFQTSLPIK